MGKRRRQFLLRAVGAFTIAYLVVTRICSIFPELGAEQVTLKEAIKPPREEPKALRVRSAERIMPQSTRQNTVEHLDLGNQKALKNLKSTIESQNRDPEDDENQKVEMTARDGEKVSEIPSELMPTLEKILQRNFEDNVTPKCEKGFFRVEGMDKCRRWLNCDEINNKDILIKIKKIGGGIGKLVYSGLVGGEYPVAIVFSRSPSQQRLGKRAMTGNQNLLMMQPSPYVIQVIGMCEQPPNSTIITESCDKCMDLWKLRKRNKNSLNKFKDRQRFEWAVRIVGGFDFLHHGLKKPRVHCDLHTAEEALTQYLVTKDKKLFMGDLDEIPEVDAENGVYAKCLEETGGIMKTPEFIAPEQRYTVQEYKEKKSQKQITEKSDIWKIPDLTKILLEGAKSESNLMKKLENIHAKCKITNPKMRPKAREVFIEYLKVYKEEFG